MADETESLILQILKRIQADVTDLKGGQRRIESRLSVIEERMSSMESHLPKLYMQSTGHHDELSELRQRVDRIERRLELTED
jgi:archaellum component FlaC